MFEVLFYTGNLFSTGFSIFFMKQQQAIFYKFLKAVLRISLAAAIIGSLVWLRKDQLRDCLQEFNCSWGIPALICVLFHTMVCSWRWRRLAQLQGFSLSELEAYSLTMQGYFFSLVIPGGAIGGDVAKMGLLARRSQPGSRAEGIFTVFMDRVIGMIALFALCIILVWTFAVNRRMLQIGRIELDSAGICLGAAVISAICLAGIICGIAIFFHRALRKIPGVDPLLNWIDRRCGNLASRMTAMADQYAKYPAELIKLTLASIAGVHIMCILPTLFMLAGAGVELSSSIVLLILTAVCLGNIAGLIPITPGGIGMRDLTVITLLHAGGITSGTGETAQLLTTGITIFINLLGGLFLIFDSAVSKSAPKQESGNHE